MVTITLEAKSISDLKNQMREFIGDHEVVHTVGLAQLMTSDQIKSAVTQNDVKVEAPTPKSVTAAPEKKETKKRKRRTKAEIEAEKAAKDSNGATDHGSTSEEFETKVHDAHAEEPASTPNVAPPTAAPKTAPPISNKESVHQALQRVNVEVGLPKAREILQHFNVNRMSEVKESQYPEFIDKCNEALMMG